MLYLIAPGLSGVYDAAADEFVREIQGALPPSQHSVLLASADQIIGTHVTDQDGIALFASSDPQGFDASVVRLLRRASARDVPILPVAMDNQHTYLPSGSEARAVFRVAKNLEARDLPHRLVGPIARKCAWSLLSLTRPTYAHQQLTAFVSYGRPTSDIAQRFVAAFSQTNRVILDDDDFRSGSPVRSEIETALRQSDVLVLLDSASAIGSEWVDWEISTAVRLGVPIVWVACDEAVRDGRNHTLPDLPDLRLADVEGDIDALADETDRIARAKLLLPIPRAEGFVGDLIEWAEQRGGDVVDRDPRLRIVEFALPDGSTRRYRNRRPTHMIQVFARRPVERDCEALTSWLETKPTSPERTFDDAVIASAAPVGELELGEHDPTVTSTDSYLSDLAGAEDAPRHAAAATKRLLLFGAFPIGTDATEHIVQAARQLTSTWVRLSGSVTFGGHPTITMHVISAARNAAGDTASKERITLYQSGYWPPQPHMDDIRLAATVVSVPAVSGDKELSLDAMRAAMIGDNDFVAAVAIGGRTDVGDDHLRLGIPHEVDLARGADIPVFLLGATGGAAAHLAIRHSETDPPFAGLNDSPLWMNQDFLSLDNYVDAAVRVFEAVNG